MLHDGGMRGFKRLDVWQRAFRLSLTIYCEADSLPARHRFVLGDQLTPAALSIPANIAEGAGRETVKEFRRYLTIALGSASELENHLLIADGLGLLTDASGCLQDLSEIQRMLSGLRRNVRS